MAVVRRREGDLLLYMYWATCTRPGALGQVYSGVYTLKRYVPRITALHPPPASAGARQAHPVEFEPAFANQFDQAA